MSKKILGIAWDYLVLSMGTFVFCIAWVSFLIPNEIASGGLTGLCTVIQFATLGKIPVSYSYIVINTLLLLAGFLIMGSGFGFRTIYCIVLTTVLFEVLPRVDFLLSLPGHPLYVSEKVLIPIIAGLIEALGVSWIFSRGGSTGGTDVVALVLNKFWPVSPGKVFIVLDLFIIFSVLLVPGKGFQDMVYGYIAMITFSLMLDFILLGRKSTVQMLIFSSRYEEIAGYINGKMHRGVTVLRGMGWYSRGEKDVLLVMLRKNQVSEITKVVKRIDPKAFVTISPVNSVYGEGFEEIKSGISRERKQKLNDNKEN